MSLCYEAIEVDMVVHWTASRSCTMAVSKADCGFDVVSFPDLLAKAYLAKPLAAFGKTFVRRSGTRFGFLLVPRGAFRPIYTYFKPNYLNFYSSLSYS